MEWYRSGHNEAHSKCVWGQPHVGSNPTHSAINLYKNTFCAGFPLLFLMLMMPTFPKNTYKAAWSYETIRRYSSVSLFFFLFFVCGFFSVVSFCGSSVLGCRKGDADWRQAPELRLLASEIF